MIDRALNFTQTQTESYYFQLYPLSLTIVLKGSEVPAPGTTYQLQINKGQQKFDENKVPIQAQFKLVRGLNTMVFPKCPLNFYLPNFTKGRKTQFQVKLLQTEKGQQYDVGEFIFNPEPFINKFKDQKICRFEEKNNISEDYELEYEIYVERSRFALEKLVKQFKNQRGAKSPFREKRQGSTRNSPSPSSGFQSASKTDRQSEIKQNKTVKPAETLRESKQSESRSVRSQAKSNEVQTETQQSKIENQNQNASQSGRSAKFTNTASKVPILATKFKPIASKDAKAQEPMKSSIRLNANSSSSQSQAKKQQITPQRERILLIVFLVLSTIFMYFAMHPNKKV